MVNTLRRWRLELGWAVANATGRVVCVWRGQHLYSGNMERQLQDGTVEGFTMCGRCGHRVDYFGVSRIAARRP